ncbi:MAG: HK97 family phage prohead protease [Alphaproteobacteria bacterium]|nr:HK97 family phage prohead protease [Alphaproteobacteria bacterium]
MIFEGYASRFGQADAGGDLVLPGAFAGSLARRGTDGVRLLYQHDSAEPIGRWLQIREDATGLLVRGELLTGIQRAEEAARLVLGGALDGLSIGFRAVRAQKSRGSTSPVRRLISEIDLWEISLVTFPMMPGARILRVLGASAPSDLAESIRRAASAML